MTDEKLAPVLRSWLRHRDVPAPDSTRTAAHVLARLPRVHQRRRWWHLPTLRRRSGPPVAHAGLPTPATHLPIDRYPTVTGRTMAMFSPVKAVIAGALVFALGGLYYVAQPADRPGPGAPAAEDASVPGVTVTVSQACDAAEGASEVCTWVADDPRLSGSLTHDWVGDISDDREGVEGDLRVGFSWLEGTFENPDGTWDARVYVMWTDPISNLLVLSGTGEHEGWHYLATAEGGPSLTWTGILYEGELPPFGPLAAPSTE